MKLLLYLNFLGKHSLQIHTRLVHLESKFQVINKNSDGAGLNIFGHLFHDGV